MLSTAQYQAIRSLCLLPLLLVAIFGASATSSPLITTLPAFSAPTAATEGKYSGLWGDLALPDRIDKRNDSVGAIEHYIYNIPSTTLALRIHAYPPRPIDRRALGQTILQAQARVRKHIEKEGDGELWIEDDPFEEDHRRSGKCFFGLSSQRDVPATGIPVKLNYSTVGHVLQGLWQFAFIGKKEYEMVFKVEDRARERRREGEELVGLGKLLSSGYAAEEHNIEIE